MAAFKNVALLGSHWESICSTLDSSYSETDKKHARLIREQLAGTVKVTANSKTVKFSAPKGGDLRDSTLMVEIRG